MNKSNISTFISLVGEFIKVYPVLRDIIDESECQEDPDKYIAFRSGCIRAKWFNTYYLSTNKISGLKSSLTQLPGTHAKIASELQVNMFKDQIKKLNISGNKNFIQLEILLPKILKELILYLPENKSTFTTLLQRLEKEIYLTNTRQPNIIEKDESQNLISSQNKQLEIVINTVLQSMSKKLAHELRLRLSKSDNKLSIIQDFINKNNITIGVTI